MPSHYCRVPTYVVSLTAALLSLSTAASSHGEKTSGNAPSPVVSQIATNSLANAPGQSVTLVRVKFPPGAESAAHRHAGAVTVFVLSGSVKSQLGDGQVETFYAGQSFFEPPGALHTFAGNASATEPAEILAVFVAPTGATLTEFEKGSGK